MVCSVFTGKSSFHSKVSWMLQDFVHPQYVQIRVQMLSDNARERESQNNKTYASIHTGLDWNLLLGADWPKNVWIFGARCWRNMRCAMLGDWKLTPSILTVAQVAVAKKGILLRVCFNGERTWNPSCLAGSLSVSLFVSFCLIAILLSCRMIDIPLRHKPGLHCNSSIALLITLIRFWMSCSILTELLGLAGFSGSIRS